jgi:hypothetical protein
MRFEPVQESSELKEERRELVDRITFDRGTLEEQERWLDRLVEITPWFFCSDAMLSIERCVEARRVRDRLEAEYTGKVDRQVLIAFVRKIANAEGTESEVQGILSFVDRHVPPPRVSDLIFWSEREMTPEEIVDTALGYQPIVLPAP